MTLCFVCFQYLRTPGEAHLAVQDAVLIAKSLGSGGQHRIYFLYSGEMDRESLTEANIIPVAYTTVGKGFPKLLQALLTYPLLTFSI
ncbi:MAG: hypothetical protein GY940_41605, partial [bacterium]|nr:hypothetical protein [bacterium]